MATPTYVTDLVDLDTADTNAWVEPTSWTAGTVVSPETDFFIQGSGCAAKYMASGGTGVGALVRDNGSGVTIPSPGGFFIWIYPQGVNQLNNFANGGLRLIVGSSTANFYGWRVAGDDTIPYGGWTNWVVDPSAPTTVTDDGTGLDADYQVGTPDDPLTKRVFGAGVNQQVNAKGGTGFDVMRYGRGELKIEFGAVADGFATFVGAATENDNTSKRWGLFQAISGGYLYKGLLLFGSATNAVDFRDSNTSILIQDTARVTSDFNTVEIRHGSSRVDWTSVSFLALGTVARGNFTVTNDADVNWTGCTFTDVGLFTLLANTTALNCVFRRTDKITANGAALLGCEIDNNRATSALLWNVATNTNGKLDDTKFTSRPQADTGVTTMDSPVDVVIVFSRSTGSFIDDGFVPGMTIVASGFGGERDGTHTIDSVAATTIDTATVRTESGSTGDGDERLITNSGHAIEFGANTPATIGLFGVGFSGYGADDTANASIYNNSGKHLDISILGGGSIPTVRNGSGASTTIISGQIAVTFTGMKDNTEVRIYDAGTGDEIAGTENATDGSPENRSFTWSDAASNVVDYVIHSLLYETIRVEGFTVPASNTSIPIQQRLDRNYENP
jgi:hypothetical protein